MVGIDVAITFSALMFAICFIPAPDITQVLIQSSLQGKMSGIIMVLGICSALVLNSAAVILGMAAVLQTSVIAFYVMQWVGVAYLTYLAVYSLFIESKRKIEGSNEILSPWNLYRRGLLITLLNPLAIILLSMLLTPFIDHDAGNIPFQMLQLCGLMILVVFLVFTSFSIVADLLLKKWLHSMRARKRICYLSGGIILVFAGFLAMAKPTL